MEKARCNTELYSNLRAPHNNVKPSNFWGSHHNCRPSFYILCVLSNLINSDSDRGDGDIIEAVDVEGCSLITCKDDIRMIQGPLKPMAEEMSLEPAITMLGILQEFQIIDLKNDLSIGRVNISS